MTNITGKIYQMQNAAGTENRFPRTVMEAVLGLNSYLQNQFSALADIYMPIEGISEAFTGQEFVYRKSPNTIKAKSLTLDRIKGKTLAWNQQVQMPEQGDAHGWTLLQNPAYNADGSFTITPADDWGGGEYDAYVPIVGHKYYVRSGIQCTGIMRIFMGGTYITGDSTHPTKTYVNAVFEATSAQALSLWGTQGVPATFWDIEVIDLTLMFGAGNEPTSVAEFETLYPDYHPYNPGTLISNDAEAVETTGVNQWNEEWEVGSIDNNGAFVADNTSIRAKNYYPVQGGETYRFTGGNAVIYCYDANKTFIPYTGQTGSPAWRRGMDISNTTFIIPTGTFYIRFCMSSAYGATYQNNICINLSNPAINGQYFPYKKSRINLGLKNIKVVSPNVWDEQVSAEGKGLVASSGAFTDDSSCFVTSYIPVNANTEYYVNLTFGVGSGMEGICYYDANKNFLSGRLVGEYNAGFTLTPPTGAAYIRATGLLAHKATGCINVSDPAFNGRYFPSGTLTLEGGVKGAGSVYDEIVGNKYIKRVGSVDLGSLTYTGGSSHVFRSPISDIKKSASAYAIANIITPPYQADTPIQVNSIDKTIASDESENKIAIRDESYFDNAAFKSAMSGVMLYYELATPEEYELVEPLIYTIKAGTTEARISPNSDGLSAPFCCDMTYSANENNDAGNAQYAATAGRLLNTHKIWGQDFNGSEDISGALTGVTTLDASGLATLRGGISVPATADAKHGTLDFIDGDRIKHISVVTLEEYPASPDLNTIYIIYQD